jgi:hypothetical protein
MIDSLPLLCFAGVMLAIIAWIIIHRVLFKRLARHHAAAFPTQEKRTIFQKGAMIQLFFICEFIYKKDYVRLGDGTVTTLSRILKALLPIGIICFVGMMLSPFALEIARR